MYFSRGFGSRRRYLLLHAMMLWLMAAPGASILAGQTRYEEAEIPNPPIEPASTVVDWPLPRLRHELPELRKLQPATDQGPLAGILSRVGTNVARMLQDFPSTASRENVLEEILSPSGSIAQTLSQDFYYLALADSESGRPGLREYRTDREGRPSTAAGLDRGFVLTSGFISTPIHFHPEYQAESQFRYLGTEVVDKRETRVVAFAQKPKAREKTTFDMGDRHAVALVQGVAWIDAGDGQILRLRTDLLRPELEIGLENETTEVKFGAVQFKGAPKTLWLPREVTVEGRFVNGATFRDVHRYSNFKLFAVDAEQKALKN